MKIYSFSKNYIFYKSRLYILTNLTNVKIKSPSIKFHTQYLYFLSNTCIFYIFFRFLSTFLSIMYIDNGRNILTISNLWLAQDYFRQIQQSLDSLHNLLFAGLLPPSLLMPQLNAETTISVFDFLLSGWKPPSSSQTTLPSSL